MYIILLSFVLCSARHIQALPISGQGRRHSHQLMGAQLVPLVCGGFGPGLIAESGRFNIGASHRLYPLLATGNTETSPYPALEN